MTFRETKTMRFAAVFLAILILNQAFFPTVTLALTGGPSQPEVKGFTPIGATDMVDLFTGDFSYNIPLMDVDGYPLNLSYQSNPGMDDEASWVGLGWSLNPGVITRSLRGFPDDFNGDTIVKQFHMKEDKTYGASLGASAEIFGIFGLGLKGGAYHNSYRGWGVSIGATPSINLKKTLTKITKIDTEKPDTSKTGVLNASLSASFNFDSQKGADIAPSISIGASSTEKLKGFSAGLGLSTNINSRKGLRELSFSMSVSKASEHTLRELKKDDVARGRSYSASTGSSFNFAGFTYFPTSTMPIDNNSATFNGTIGGEFFGFHGNVRITGWASEQEFRTNTMKNEAFGYLHSGNLEVNGQDNVLGLYDYNRENAGAFRMDNPTLPMIFGTYDLFSASGQGVGGQFRASRNDVGVFRQPVAYTNSTSKTLGIELGGGNAFHGGFDKNDAYTQAKSESWKDDNNIRDVLRFTQRNLFASSPLAEKQYEPVYFKATGEFSPVTNPEFYTNLGESNAIYIDLDKTSKTVSADRNLIAQKFKKTVHQNRINELQRKLDRAKRNTVFSYLTGSMAAVSGLDTAITFYPPNDFDCDSKNYSSRLSRNKNHMSEVSVLKKDGSRYIYGIPSYNNYQKEHTFSIAETSDIGNTLNRNSSDFSLVGYGANDATVANRNGKDEYYESQKIPEYAHSFLLTGILSPDYLDRTGDGITADDLGTATKINYSKTSSHYYWRTPYQLGKARYQQGLKSIRDDDKGSYLEGEKELYYVHSIESRTMVAQFYISPREDALSPAYAFTSSSIHQMQKLDSIKLYSKSDLNSNPTDAIPIKTVFFEYSYDLCPGIPNRIGGVNSNKGKLTLEKIYFTYGNSKKGKLTPYEFDYKTGFNYNLGYYDRWGNYQKNPSNYPSNLEFPYTIQDTALANANAAAWSLNKITLPSGGVIHVEYEADDYAYIQDKVAGQMMPIKGFTDFVGQVPENRLYSIDGKNTSPKRYLVIDLPNPVVDISRYIRGLEELYFKALVDLDNRGHEEYVFGYVECVYDDAKIVNGLLYLPIKFAEGSKGVELHPFTKAGLQMLRMRLPEYAYGTGDPDGSLKNAFKQIAHMGKELKAMFKGYDRTKVRDGWSQKVVTANKSSWVRLNNPYYKKIGGGSRVRSIKVTDSWDVMTSNSEAALEIGQYYRYERKGDSASQPSMISSGVASYEPLLGGDEISLRQPMSYIQNVKLAPDESYYSERPIGESLYPSPTVGYSRVEVRSINNESKRTATGYTVSEFYTAKDFPVIADFTNLSDGLSHLKSSPFRKIFKLKEFDDVTASQGYMVEVNDMHGKPKAEFVYDENDALLSSKEYFYKLDPNNPNHLSNEVNFITPDGDASVIGEIGKEIDVWQEMQQDRTSINAMGLAMNTEAMIFGVFPFIFPPLIPKWSKSEETLRTSVTTKLIKRFGIMDSVRVMENGSSVTTKNLLYDSETGDVLLTETVNEFNDPIYNFTYPAHWAYDGMGMAYKNQGQSVVTTSVFSDGIPQDANILEGFTAGDEVLIDGIQFGGVFGSSFFTKRAYVMGKDDGNLSVIDIDGEPINGIVFLVSIVRSGRKNMPSVPIGSVVSLKNPVSNGTLDMVNSKPVSASAVTFSDKWGMECELGYLGKGRVYKSDTINPYVEGVRGNWRPDSSFVFYNPRNQNFASSTTRESGVISAFTEFWKNQNGWKPLHDASWVESNVISEYDIHGNELENFDAIAVPSAAIFGYNHSKVVAIAQNSLVSQIANDNFEDYYFEDLCDSIDGNKKYYSIAPNINKYEYWYNSNNLHLNDSISHTGKYSLKVTGLRNKSTVLNIKCCPDIDAAFTMSYDTIMNQTSVINFVGLPDSSIYSYFWNFGNSTSTEQNPSVGFDISNDSTATVTLTVSIGDCMDTYSHVISLIPVAAEAAAAPADNSMSSSAYVTGCEDCIHQLSSADPDSVFLFSVWVATDSSLACGQSILESKNTVIVLGNSSSETIWLESSPVIDGWQQLRAKIIVHGSNQWDINLYGLPAFENDYFNTVPVYFDDFRLQPWDSNMKTYVYDPTSLRLMAELDENNYATFYEYDEEGNLIRVKRETDEGVKTIQESRTELKKQ